MWVGGKRDSGFPMAANGKRDSAFAITGLRRELKTGNGARERYN